jgi:adenylosuccinate lyase
MTSSDVLDTATGMQLKSSGELILTELSRLAEILKLKARQYKKYYLYGSFAWNSCRATSFGLKFAPLV